MHRFAVLSDVNANLEALCAVLHDIESLGVSDLLFLGDAVGYGPDPVECVSRLRERVQVYLCGRLEYLMIHNRENELPYPEREMIAFTREALCSGSDHWEWLRDRPSVYTAPGVMAVHANPTGQQYECLLLENILFRPVAASSVFSRFTKTLFVGDNHQPWVLTESNVGYTEKAVGYQYNLSGTGKAIVSVGSVGQPRDGDSRACYVIASDESIVWRRLEYDLDRTVAKLLANPRLAKHYAFRLREGV